MLLLVLCLVFCFVACRDLFGDSNISGPSDHGLLNLRTPMPLALGMHKGLLKTDHGHVPSGDAVHFVSTP